MTDEPTTKATQVLPQDPRTESAESPKVGNPSQSPAPGAIREAPDQNEEDGDERETVSEEPHPSQLSEGSVGESAPRPGRPGDGDGNDGNTDTQAKAGTAAPDERSQGDRSKSSTQESKPARAEPAGPQSQQNKPNPSGQQFQKSPQTKAPSYVVGSARKPGPVQGTSPAGSQKGGGSPV